MIRSIFALFVLGYSLLAGCAESRRPPLAEYSAHNRTERVILPTDYVAYLKREKFTHGELDHLPGGAIILHHDDVESYLKALGYSKWETLQTGQTDPNVMYVVREPGKAEFIINRGLPGAGGITTQAAELAALGVKQIIHIGTAGWVGADLPERAIVLSLGCQKDGAAVLLSEDPNEPISEPDAPLVVRIATVAASQNVQMNAAVGYTSPIFYLQPAGLIKSILDGGRESYVEMEGASLFEIARRLHVAAASIVIGGDRYTLDRDGTLKHDYFNSTREQEIAAMKIAIEALTN